MALLPQAELCPFHGSAGLVSLAGKIAWLVLNLFSLMLFLLDEAYSHCLWFALVFCCCFPCVCNKISGEGC